MDGETTGNQTEGPLRRGGTCAPARRGRRERTGRRGTEPDCHHDPDQAPAWPDINEASDLRPSPCPRTRRTSILAFGSGSRASRLLRRSLYLCADLVVVGLVVGPVPGPSQIPKTCPYLFLRERRDRFPILWQEGRGTVRRAVEANDAIGRGGWGSMADDQDAEATIGDGADALSDLLDVLGRQAALCERQRVHALEEENWLYAFDGLVQSLRWRAKRLAFELDILSIPFAGSKDRVEELCQVRRACHVVMQSEAPSPDKADRYHKAEAVADILTSLIDTLEIMVRPTGRSDHCVYALIHQAAEIGRAEVGLSFAETGFWDEVARWKAQRGGRPEGTLAKWSTAALPEIRAWIDAEADISTEGLVAKLWDWLVGYAANNKHAKTPEYESLRRSLDRMHDRGEIVLPTRQKLDSKLVSKTTI